MAKTEELLIKLNALSGILTAIWEMSETGSGPCLTNALRGAIDYLETISSTVEESS